MTHASPQITLPTVPPTAPAAAHTGISAWLSALRRGWGNDMNHEDITRTNESPRAPDPVAETLGCWIGEAAGSYHGDSNLLDYRLTWHSSAGADKEDELPSIAAAGRSIGFDDYVGCLHPDEVEAELQSLRLQLLNRASRIVTLRRLRTRQGKWMDVCMLRDFDFSRFTGELTRVRLTVALTANAALFQP